MISWKQICDRKEEIAVWVWFWLFIDSNEKCINVNVPSTGLSGIHPIAFHDHEIPEGIDNCTKDDVRGDILRPPHKHLTPTTVDINNFLWYDLPEANMQ